MSCPFIPFPEGNRVVFILSEEGAIEDKCVTMKLANLGKSRGWLLTTVSLSLFIQALASGLVRLKSRKLHHLPWALLSMIFYGDCLQTRGREVHWLPLPQPGDWEMALQGVVGEHDCRCLLASHQTFKVQGPSRGSRAVGGRDSQVDFDRLMGPLSPHKHAQTPFTLFRPCFHLVC